MSTLPASIRSLTVSEKVDLLDALWRDLDGVAPSEAQEEELDRRVALYEQERDAVVSWEQVRARLQKR